MRKNKIIRVVIIILLLLIILMQNISSFAVVELTEEKLKNALDNVCGYNKTVHYINEEKGFETTFSVNNEDITYQIDMNKRSIELDFGEESDYNNCIINYNLEKTNSPEFMYSLIYNNNMDSEKVFIEYLKGEYISNILVETVANAEGILPEDAAAFRFEQLLSSILEKANLIEENNSDGITVAKKIYSNNLNISNDYINVIYEVEEETEEEYKVKVIMKIKEDADFSTMNGYAMKMLKNSDVNNNINNDNSIFFTNSLVQDSVIDSDFNSGISIKNDSIAMANILIKENEEYVRKYYNPNLSKYPNAGLEENIFVPIIEITIGILFAMLIMMIIKVRKYNID